MLHFYIPAAPPSASPREQQRHRCVEASSEFLWHRSLAVGGIAHKPSQIRAPSSPSPEFATRITQRRTDPYSEVEIASFEGRHCRAGYFEGLLGIE